MGKATYETLINIFLCYPIFLDDVLDDMICLINAYVIFTLDNFNVEEI